MKSVKTVMIVAGLAITLAGCATMTLSRVDPNEIESIGVAVYREDEAVDVLIPGVDYRYETVFQLAGEDRVRRDPGNDGVQFFADGVIDRTGEGQDFFSVPHRYALAHGSVDLSFRRVFGEESATSTLEWRDSFQIAWPDYVSRVYDGEEGGTPLLLLTDGGDGGSGKDVTVALAHYDATGIPSARADRMIAVAFLVEGSAQSEVLLLDHRARIEVYSRGGRGGAGRDRTTVAPRATSSSPGSVAGERGGRGGTGGTGGTVRVVATDSGLLGVVGVDVSGGPGGAGGKGGENLVKQSKVEYPGTVNERTIYSYRSSGRAAEGRSGNGGRAGSRNDSTGSVMMFFNGAPSWFETSRIIDIES